MRREGVEHPYELLQQLTRGNTRVVQQTILQFIESIDVSEDVKSELRHITPFNYVGYL